MKKETENCEHFQGTNLLRVAYKLYVAMISGRIIVTNGRLLNEEQTGFRRRSCMDSKVIILQFPGNT
jgi:hypothetical protein